MMGVSVTMDTRSHLLAGFQVLCAHVIFEFY